MYTFEDALVLEAYTDLLEKLVEEGRMMEIPSIKQFREAYEVFHSEGFDPDTMH
tara:strand:+ start:218 stop:379 length:162 start_codon:yes stop_codon:yes gene_type:complete